MKLPRYAGVVPPSLDFLRVSELENLMRKTQEGDSPPKPPKKFMSFSYYLQIKKYIDKIRQIVYSRCCLSLKGRKEVYF